MKKNKIVSIIIGLLFIISCPFLTLQISNGEEKNLILIGCIISFLIGTVISVKVILNHTFDSKKLFISTIVALFIDKVITKKRQNVFDVINDLVLEPLQKNPSQETIFKIIAILVIPALCVLVYFFIQKIIPLIKEESNKLTKIEKGFIIIMAIGGLLLANIIAHYTTAFYLPYSKENDSIYNYDIIYTSDNGIIIGGDAYANICHPENDIRQPLFGVLALPFGIIGHFFGELLFFSPNYQSYAISMVTIQFILIAISIVMMGKMLGINEKNKTLFFLFFLVSAPYLIFSYCLEQYVIGLFYLILTIYVFVCRKEKINFCYIGATGTLLTSGILFPIITRAKKFRQWVIDVFKCFVAFVCITCVGGQFPQFANINKIQLLLKNYSGHVEIIDKIYQFSVFVKTTLFFPPGEIVRDARGFFAYRLVNPEVISRTGILILVIVIISFIVNRKEKIAKICFSWVMFSIIILGFVGWGAFENGMILYSLYFSWAYICLIYMLIRKVLRENITLINIFMTLGVIGIFMVNIQELLNIFNFAIQYYG